MQGYLHEGCSLNFEAPQYVNNLGDTVGEAYLGKVKVRGVPQNLVNSLCQVLQLPTQ